MTDTQSSHDAFRALVHEFYRTAGKDLPYFDSDPDTPTAFELAIDGVNFRVGHDPHAVTGNLFVYCAFGPVPQPHAEAVLRRLLEINLTLTPRHSGAFCIDGETQELVLCRYLDIARVALPCLRDDMVRTTRLALLWRSNYFLDGQVDFDVQAFAAH